MSFQPAHVALNEVLAAVGQHRLRQGELVGGRIGGVYPPPQPTDGDWPPPDDRRRP